MTGRIRRAAGPGIGAGILDVDRVLTASFTLPGVLSSVMIDVFGASPAWQHLYCIEDDRDEVVRARDFRAFASGKATNAARHLATLADEPVRLTTPVGGPLGEAFADWCEGRFSLRPLATPAATRCCTTVLRESGETTELIGPTLPLDATAAQRFLESLSKPATLRLFCGSLPSGLSSDRVLTSLGPGLTVLDSASILLPEIPSDLGRDGDLVVKVSRTELPQVIGRPTATLNDLASFARQVGVAFVVTDAGNPVWVASREVCEHLPVDPVDRIVCAIGAGDATTAALAAALHRGDSLLDAASFAIRFAAAYLQTPPPDPVSFATSA